VIRPILPILALSATLAACRSDDRAVEIVSTRPFSEGFERVASIRLEQSDSLPLVAPMKLAVSPQSGTIALPDFSEGHVRLFDSTGRHLRTLGRKGHGPGEFIAPVSAAWDARGNLHVLDIQRALVSVFDSAGTHVREVSLVNIGTALDFATLPDGGYLLLGSPSPPDLLTRIDSAGDIVRSYLPVAEFRPKGASDPRVWEQTLMPQMRVTGTTAVVILSPADSVWMVDLKQGSASSHPIRPDGYMAPSDPKSPVQEAAALDAWVEGSDRIRGLAVDGSKTFVTFARGAYDRPDATLLIRDAEGRLEAFTGAQVVHEVTGGRLLTGETTDTSFTLILWRPRK
jgi:hypothetical protein